MNKRIVFRNRNGIDIEYQAIPVYSFRRVGVTHSKTDEDLGLAPMFVGNFNSIEEFLGEQMMKGDEIVVNIDLDSYICSNPECPKAGHCEGECVRKF